MANSQITLKSPNGKTVVLPRIDLVLHSVFFRELLELRPDDVEIHVESDEHEAFEAYKRWAALDLPLAVHALPSLSRIADKYQIQKLPAYIVHEIKWRAKSATIKETRAVVAILDNAVLDSSSRAACISLLAEKFDFVPPWDKS